MKYAILYKINLYDEEFGFYYLTVDRIMELDGKNEDNVYLLQKNENNELKDYYIWNVTTKEELEKRFNCPIGEAVNKWYDSEKDGVVAGFICEDLIYFEDIIFNENELYNDLGYQFIKILVSKQFDSGEVTLLSLEDLIYILTEDNKENIDNYLFSLQKDKTNSFSKYKNGNGIIQICEEQIIENYINYDIEKLKNEINEDLELKLNEADDYYYSNEETGNKYVSFITLFVEVYNNVINNSNNEYIVYLYHYIEDLLGYVRVKSDNFNENEFTFINKILNYQLIALEKMNKMNDEELIENYKSFYKANINSIYKISQILFSNGVALNRKNIDFDYFVDEEVDIDLSFNYLNVYNEMNKKVLNRQHQISGILNTISIVDNNYNEDKKYSCLIAGTTGTGKTHTFSILKKILVNRPVCIADTNQITQQGYVGGSIEDVILLDLLNQAHQINYNEPLNGLATKSDIELAQHGIVFLDEIDKRRNNGSAEVDVNGEGVVNQLLKFMDGTVYSVEIDKFNSIPFNTSNLVIFAGGAFQEYFDKKEKHIGIITEDVKEKVSYEEVSTEELVKYGLDSQFVGRFTNIILYPKHTKESLLELELNKKTSMIENKRMLFKDENVSLVWDDEYLESAVDEAFKLKTGARGIGQMIERCTGDAYSEIKKYPGMYKILYLTKECLEKPELAVLIKNDNSYSILKDIIDSSKEDDKKLREKVNCSKTDLKEAKKLIRKLKK